MSDVALLGYEPSSDSGTFASTNLYFYRFVASKSGTLHSIKIKSGGSMNVRVGVYSDSSSVPSTRLVQSDSTAVVSGWNTITVSDTSIEAGTVYWLACQTETSTTLVTGSTKTTARYKSNTYSSGLPSSAGTTTSATDKGTAIVGYGEETIVISWGGTWGG